MKSPQPLDKPMTRAVTAALGLLAAALLAVALADEARAATVDVTISGSRFQPQTVEVRQGDVVRWNNNDAIAHSSKSQSNWDTGTIGASGGSASVTMHRTGTFGYVCAFHPSMTGTVRVLEAVANSPPSVAISSPAANGVVSGTAALAGTASDLDGDALTVSIRIDAGEFQTVPLSGGSWSYAWDTRNVTNGAHSLTARVSDGKETTTSGTVQFTVNNVPTITLAAPEENLTVAIGTLVGVAGTTSVPFGSNVTVEVSIDDGPWEPVSGRTLWSYSWDTSGYEAGEHTVQARVRDELNTILSPLRVVTLVIPVPDEPPLLLVRTPAAGALVAGLVNVSGNVTDPDGSVPLVEVSVDGGEWVAVSGRAGELWWHEWTPVARAPGGLTIAVRATADNATVLVTRHVSLSASPAPLVVEAQATREASPVLLRVITTNETPTLLPGARVVLLDAELRKLHEAVSNESGVAAFPALRPGAYDARAYAPGAAGSLSFEVRSLYDIDVTPKVIDFERPVPIVVSVRAETGVRNVQVQLQGAPLAGGVGEMVRTAADGNATLHPHPLAAGELAVFVRGNDTGLRVRVAPTVLVTWTPAEPEPGQLVTGRFTLNDLARTPLAGVVVPVDVPGTGRESKVTDATGALTVRPTQQGTVRAFAPREGLPGIVHEVAVRPPPPMPELSGLVTRGGPASLLVSVVVKNVGEAAGAFTIDAMATNGLAAVQESVQTRELAPGEEERVTTTLAIGQGEYDVLVTARNSGASVSGVGRVADEGVPPPLSPDREPPALPLPPAAAQEENESPGAAMGALVALALVALARGRRRSL